MNLYIIETSSRPKRLYWADRIDNDYSKDCSESAYCNGDVNFDTHITYKSMHGQELQDVIGTSGLGTLFSPRLMSFIVDNKISGLEGIPVTLLMKNEEPELYYLVRADNRCDKMDSSGSRLIHNEKNPNRPLKYGYRIKPESILKNITTPIGTRFLLCDEKTKLILEPNFSGFRFTNINDLQVYTY